MSLRQAAVWAFGCAVTVAATVLLGAQAVPSDLGEPLAGLTANELLLFREGREDFLIVETPQDGVGPAFNGTSCASCHNVPALGGIGVILETRAARRNDSGESRGLNDAGDTLIHLFSVPPHGCQPLIPEDANVIAHRMPVPLFGAGLIEAIADDTLRDLEDPFDRNGDGVRGRAAVVVDLASGESRIGRFGWKAQHATLLAFAADAYRNEMGRTNVLLPGEYAYGLSDEQIRKCDAIPDPEDRPGADGRSGITNFAAFMKFLAPVARASIDDTIREGERVFGAIGCATCHRPLLETGARPSGIPPKTGRVVFESAAPRHRHWRRDPAAASRGRADPHTGLMGPAVPQTLSA